VVTCGGTAADGASCVFPFQWGGNEHHTCTEEDHDQPWCYTTDGGRWGNCNCDTESPPVGTCVNPHSGTTQDDCCGLLSRVSCSNGFVPSFLPFCIYIYI
jgi:hypothetical protein